MNVFEFHHISNKILTSWEVELEWYIEMLKLFFKQREIAKNGILRERKIYKTGIHCIGYSTD